MIIVHFEEDKILHRWFTYWLHDLNMAYLRFSSNPVQILCVLKSKVSFRSTQFSSNWVTRLNLVYRRSFVLSM